MLKKMHKKIDINKMKRAVKLISRVPASVNNNSRNSHRHPALQSISKHATRQVASASRSGEKDAVAFTLAVICT